MTRLQSPRLQSPSTELPSWCLAAGQVLRLPRQARARQLWVTQGRVWATPTGRDDPRAQAPSDVWLSSGQWHTLPAGSEWVLEAAEAAQPAGFHVLEAPPAA